MLRSSSSSSSRRLDFSCGHMKGQCQPHSIGTAAGWWEKGSSPLFVGFHCTGLEIRVQSRGTAAPCSCRMAEHALPLAVSAQHCREQVEVWVWVPFWMLFGHYRPIGFGVPKIGFCVPGAGFGVL